MEVLFFIAVAGLVWYRLRRLPSAVHASTPARDQSPKLTQLIQYADRMYIEKKWVAAEKTYLDILKLDHRNVTAYSHLGVIYSTQKQYADAIECFQIAAQIKPSAITFQNLGLVFYENRNYIKSIAMLEKSIMFEPSANRYVGISKAARKLADSGRVISALKKAAEIEESPKILQLLHDAYVDAGKVELAAEIRPKLPAMPSVAVKSVKPSSTILALKD
jgi:tetratricopeptide (TPR) repeat protein